MHVRAAIALLLALALASCAQQPRQPAPTSATQNTIDYAKYVKYSVGSFQFNTLYDWDSSGPGHVVVWVSPIEAYRLTLSGACLGLRNTQVIGLTSHGGEVSVNHDAVIAGGDHCPIMLIQRLDARAIRALRTKPKSPGGKGG